MSAQNKTKSLSYRQPAPEQRKLPYDIESEQYILGCIMNNNNTFYKLTLPSEDFFEPLHQRIFIVINELMNQGIVADPVTIKNYIIEDDTFAEVGGANYLLKLCSLSSGLHNIQDYEYVVREMARRRIFAEYLDKYAASPLDLSFDLNAAISEMELALYRPSNKMRLMNESKIAIEIAKDLEKTLPCYPSGYPDIDNALAGGFYEDKCYFVVGGEKAGKTAVMGSFSYHLSNAGTKHLYIALEMGYKEIYKRIMAYKLRRNPMAFYDKRSREDDKFQYAVSRLAIATKGAASFVDAPGITFADLRKLVISSIRRHGFKGIFIDNIQLVTGQGKSETEAAHLKNVAQWCADITKEEHVFFVVASQQNEAGSAKGSKGITAAGDATLYLKRLDKKSANRYFIVDDTRYTMAMNIGDEANPTFRIGGDNVFLEELVSGAIQEMQVPINFN